MSKNRQELNNMSAIELTRKVDELRRELFSLNLHAVTSPVKDNTRYRKLRKEIARALTFLRLTSVQ